MQIKWNRQFIVLLTAMSLTLFSGSAFAVEKQGLDSKIAIVNGTAITQGDLDREMMGVYQQIARTGRSISESQLLDIKKEVLETLINQELLYLESQVKGFKVEDKTVNEQFENLKKRFPDEDKFKSTLSEMKVSEAEIKFQMKKKMAIQKYVDKEFVQKIEVSVKEVETFYSDHPDSFTEPEQVRARHILIKVDPEAEESKKDAARKRLKEVQKKLRDGEKFEALAKVYSEGPSGPKGGDLGYFGRGQMVKPFEEAAFGLPPGQVSGVVETQFGYHLIEVVDKKPEALVAYERVKDKLQDYLKQKKVHEKVDAHIEELKSKAKVERFMKGNS